MSKTSYATNLSEKIQMNYYDDSDFQDYIKMDVIKKI